MKLVERIEKVYRLLGDHKIEDVGLLRIKGEKTVKLRELYPYSEWPEQKEEL